MLRMGRMIRSAKMKLITPPKLIPPFHSTAASGTFPTEQTKLIIEMKGPISGPELVQRGVVGQEERTPEAFRYPGCERASDQEAQPKVDVEAVDVHVEVVRDGGESPG